MTLFLVGIITVLFCLGHILGTLGAEQIQATQGDAGHALASLGLALLLTGGYKMISLLFLLPKKVEQSLAAVTQETHALSQAAFKTLIDNTAEKQPYLITLRLALCSVVDRRVALIATYNERFPKAAFPDTPSFSRLLEKV
jgi:hypothetical protein